MPQYILEAALKAQAEAKQPHSRVNSDLKRPVRIVVTQPRRIAAITVAKRVAEELGEKAKVTKVTISVKEEIDML